MSFYSDSVGTALVDVEALPWIPFTPYSDEVFLKLIKINPVNGDWTTLLKLPAGTELPKHHHSGTVHVYTVAGSWRYKEHDWISGPGSMVFETATSAHTPVAEQGEEVITLNIVVGDWNLLDENDNILAVENWRTMLTRYSDYCTNHGIKPVDVTSFAGN